MNMVTIDLVLRYLEEVSPLSSSNQEKFLKMELSRMFIFLVLIARC